MTYNKLDDDDPSSDNSGFPGYQEGLDIFTSWAQAMKSSADDWNDLWNRVKNGKARPADFSQTIVNGVEMFSTLSRQLWRTMTGPAAPPWVNLPFPPKSIVELQISKTLSVDFPIQPVALAFLGKAEWDALNVQVSAVSPSKISLFVNESDWDAFKPQAGQYIGLIFTEEYADPIGVVSFRATADDIENKDQAAKLRSEPELVKGLVGSLEKGP